MCVYESMCVCVCVCINPCVCVQEAYTVARQFNLVPPVCEQTEYHYFQRDKVELQLPELYHKIGTHTHSPYTPTHTSLSCIEPST